MMTTRMAIDGRKVDLRESTISHLFQRQVEDLTRRTVMQREDLIDFQYSEAWI